MAHSGKTITFATDLLPNEDNIYSLGSSGKKWKIFGNVTGNADGLTHKTLNNTTLNNTAGTFAFSGAGDPWAGTDWVGLQVGDNVDKFQITANGNNLLFRQNDSGGTNTSWQSWVTLLSSGNTAAGTDNNATLTWNTAYTIAKINGTDIKFTTMAKPTYSASDVLGTSGTTAQFLRGDNSWSNTIKQTANAALGIDTNLKIGTARKDLNFDIGNGSGTGINDGYAGGITWGNSTSAYAGIYYQSSNNYGSRLIFGTTDSYANGASARMIIQNNGRIGIGTLSPDKLLTVNGEIKGKALYLNDTASDPSLTTGARIEFSYPSGQPVVLSYTPNDNYRSPAGLKILGGTSATPAWFEVEGGIYTNSYYHIDANRIDNGNWLTGATGKAPTATTTDGNTTYSGAVIGTSILTLGNNKVGANSASGVNNNAQGYLRLYSSGSAYGELTAYTTSSKTHIHATNGISFPENTINIMFRPGSGTYYTHISYQTSGNEALVSATQNAVTSFIFVNGESYANIATDRWTKLTGASGAGNAPGLQIKQNCVSIGELIPSGTNATYKLNVNGGRTRLNSTVAASASNLSSQLIVSNSNSAAVALELWRNANASWQIANDSGTLYIRNNWAATKQDTYSQNGLIMDYNTSNTAIAGTLSVGQTTRNTSYKLYVNGTGYFNGAVTATSFTGNATSASKIAAKLATTTKTTLLGVSAATTLSGTATNVELIGDTGIYLTTTAGEISALRYSIHDSSATPVEKARLEWNSTDQAIEFIFA